MARPIVTLDGPAGAGKSTVARELARRLGFRFLDTGAMYRAYTWKALRTGTSLDDPAALVLLIRASRLEMDGDRVRLDGRDISAEIRTEEITLKSRHLADPPEVRAQLVEEQRKIAREGGFVTEGRDQGSVAFPDAEHKFYLDASIEVRARRRAGELASRGQTADLKGIRAAIAARDDRDRSRPVGALRVPDGAVRIDTSDLTVEQVVAKLLQAIRPSG